MECTKPAPPRHEAAGIRLPRVIVRTEVRLSHAQVGLATDQLRWLRLTARENGTTVEAVVQAAWSILLDALTGEHELDETMPISGLLATAGHSRPTDAVVRIEPGEIEVRVRPEPLRPAADAGRIHLEVCLGPAAALRLCYPAGGIDPAAAERLLDCLLRVLEAIVVAPNQPICRVEVLGDEDCRCIRGTGTDFPASGLTVVDLFEDQVDRMPGAVALAYGEDVRTYAELDAAANRLAHRLIAENDPPVPLLLDMPVSQDLVVGLLAALKAGVTCLIVPGHAGGSYRPDPLRPPGYGPQGPALRPHRAVRATASRAFLTVTGPPHDDIGVTIHHGELLSLLLNHHLEQDAGNPVAARRPSADSLADLIATVFPPLITGGTLLVPPDAVAVQLRRDLHDQPV